MSILKHYPPGFAPRDEEQKKALLDIEKTWDKSDVIILLADVAAGKSFLMQTVARWRAALGESSALMTPRVSLQDQYARDFKDVVVLKGKSRYKCRDNMFKNCEEKKDVVGEYCSGCKYALDRATAQESKVGVFSIHSYLTLRARKDNLLIDEAQNLTPIMQAQNSIKLWKHKHKYPDDISNYDDIIIFLEKVIKEYTDEEAKLDKTIQDLKARGAKQVELVAWVTRLREVQMLLKTFNRVLTGIRNSPTNFFIEKIKDTYRGKPAEALQIRPTTLENCMGWLWPNDTTNKIVLASATLKDLDLKKWGLDKKRVTWVKPKPMIKAEDRPIIIEHVGNMGYKFQRNNLPKMLRKVAELRKRHQDTKGIVHMTYSMAEEAKKVLGVNFMFHTPENKEDKLKEFFKAPPGTVFVACGMYEGLDLAGPDYGWQAICKTPWPSKADKLIDYWYKTDFNWVAWNTARDLIQACGRVNRYPGDKAITYILDTAMGNPRKARKGFLNDFKRFFPKEFLERIV